MIYKDAIIKVAKEVELPVEVVRAAYKSYWEFIRNKIQELPLKEDLKEEDFQEMKTSFNIPSIGKLNCDYNKIKKIKEHYNKNKI